MSFPLTCIGHMDMQDLVLYDKLFQVLTDTRGNLKLTEVTFSRFWIMNTKTRSCPWPPLPGETYNLAGSHLTLKYDCCDLGPQCPMMPNTAPPKQLPGHLGTESLTLVSYLDMGQRGEWSLHSAGLCPLSQRRLHYKTETHCVMAFQYTHTKTVSQMSVTVSYNELFVKSCPSDLGMTPSAATN